MRKHLRLKPVALYALVTALLLGFAPGLAYTLTDPSVASADAASDNYIWSDLHHIIDQNTRTTYVDGKSLCYSYGGGTRCAGSYLTTTDVLVTVSPVQTNAPQCSTVGNTPNLYMWVVIGNYATATQGKFYLTCDNTNTPDPSLTPDFTGKLLNTYAGLGSDRFATWVDGSTINITPDNIEFVETNDDGNGTMTLTGPENACNSGTSTLVVPNYLNTNSATLHGYSTSQPGGRGGPVRCNTFTQTVQFLNKVSDVATTAAWTNTTDPSLATYGTITIQSLSKTDKLGGALKVGDIYQETPDEIPFTSYTGTDLTLTGPTGDCGQKLPVMTIKSYVTAYTATIDTNYTSVGRGGQQQCKPVSVNVLLTSSFNGSSGSSGGSSGSSGNCPIKGDGDWLFCMIADVASGAIDTLGGALQTLLYTPVDQIFGTPQMQTAFDSFRNIGVALLVIVGIFMVLSQAAGLEIFAAYTIRKALPRLVLAMIGMSLAWPILQFVITFFNDIGVWTMQLILSAVGISSGGAPLSSYNVGSGAVLVTVAGGALLFSTGIVMSLLGTLLLALIIGFIVLAIRQLVILIAVLMAPLAIAASILPSTQKIWHFWRESLLTALAMFPIMMAFLGAGKAMSTIAGAAAEATTDGGRSFTWKLLSVLCLIVPLFALPFAFRIAGGIVGTAHALVSGGKLGKGAFGMLSKYRAQKLGQRWNDAKTNNMWKPGSVPRWLGGGFFDRAARAGSWAAQGAALTASGHLTRSRRQAARSIINFDTAMAAAEKNPYVASILGNDDYLMAIKNAKSGSEGEIRKQLRGMGYGEREVGAVMMATRAVGYDNMRKIAATRLPGTGTAFKGADEGAISMLESLNEAFGDDWLGKSRALAMARKGGVEARRSDIGSAGGFTENLTWAQELYKLRNNKPAYDAKRAELRELADRRVLETNNPGAIVTLRENGVKRLLPAMREELDRAFKSGRPEEIGRVSAFYSSIYDEMSRTYRDSAAVLANGATMKINGVDTPTSGVMNMDVVYNNNPMTFRQYLDQFGRENDSYRYWKREYDRGIQAQQAQTAASIAVGGTPPTAGPPPVAGVPF